MNTQTSTDNTLSVSQAENTYTSTQCLPAVITDYKVMTVGPNGIRDVIRDVFVVFIELPDELGLESFGSLEGNPGYIELDHWMHGPIVP